MEVKLTAEDCASFDTHGMLVLKDFYSIREEILPIQKAIYELLGCIIQRHALDICRAPFDGDTFDDGFMDLVKKNRTYGGEVYDTVKMLPSFIRLFSGRKHQQLFETLRGGALTGISLPSQGIRIDLPNEDRFRAFWHQEFLYQPQSQDGIIFWAPLVPISPEIGPLQICPGSQKEGLLKYRKTSRDPTLPNAFSIEVKNPQETVDRYPAVAPLVEPGDLLVMDFLTLHQSGTNRSQRARWSMQMRCFNFLEPIGAKLGWPASITAGTDVESIFSEYIEHEESQ